MSSSLICCYNPPLKFIAKIQDRPITQLGVSLEPTSQWERWSGTVCTRPYSQSDGSMERRCLNTGDFSGAEPVCTGKFCLKSTLRVREQKMMILVVPAGWNGVFKSGTEVIWVLMSRPVIKLQGHQVVCRILHVSVTWCKSEILRVAVFAKVEIWKILLCSAVLIFCHNL